MPCKIELAKIFNSTIKDIVNKIFPTVVEYITLTGGGKNTSMGRLK